MERNAVSLKKPLNPEPLHFPILEATQHEHAEPGCRCDAWGHPCPGCTKSRQVSKPRGSAIAVEKS